MGYLGKTPLSRRDFGRVAATAAGLSLVPSLILVAAPDQKSGGAEQETKRIACSTAGSFAGSAGVGRNREAALRPSPGRRGDERDHAIPRRRAEVRRRTAQGATG